MDVTINGGACAASQLCVRPGRLTPTGRDVAMGRRLGAFDKIGPPDATAKDDDRIDHE